MTAKRNAWIEVDLAAVVHNYRQVAALVEPASVIPVVKANAYGHGMCEVASALSSHASEGVAVTHVWEASELRASGYTGRILVMSPPRGEENDEAVRLNLDCCLMDRLGIEELSGAASRHGGIARIHLKLDTGLGRLGVRQDSAVELVREVIQTGNIEMAGVFSHCAEGHSEPAAARQLKLYRAICESIEQNGIRIPLRHFAASAATLALPDSRLDAVRIGNLIYGQYPNSTLKKKYQGKELKLKDTWTFKTRIVAVRSLPPGSSVGYGAEYQTSRVSKIAVIPVGRVDGLGLEPSSLNRRGLKGVARALAPSRFAYWATIRGQKAPVVGRVATQLTSIDVTEVPEASIGDEVILPVLRLSAGIHIPRVYFGI